MRTLRTILTITLVIFVAIVAGIFFISVFGKISNAVKNISFPIATGLPSTNAPSCIITIDGEKYDIGPLRSTHPGGDIFVCGTDMTQIYYSFHTQAFKSHLLRYKVN